MLTGQGGFKKIEEGTLVLAGDNTFAGNVVLYKGYVKMSTANALGTAWKTVRIGPNHKENETHTQLQLTKAMDFDYNLEFVRQTGAYYYSARYLTCPGNTKINGTIHQDDKAQIANYLNANSGNLYVYGDVYLSYLYGLGGTVHFYGRVLKSNAASGTELQCQSSTAHLYASGSTLDLIHLGYGGVEFHVANAVGTNFVFNTNYEYGKAAVKLNGFDQVCNALTTTATLFNKSEAHHNVETDANKPCRLTVKPTVSRTGRYHFNGPLTLAIDSPNGSTQAVVNAESTTTADLIVSNGAFKVGYSASFPYVAGFEIGAGGTLIVTNGVTMGTGDSDFRLTTGGKLVLENGATMSVNRLFKDGATDSSAYGKTFCAPGAGVAGAVEADWIEGTGALTVNAHVVADDPHTWSGGAGTGEAAEAMTDPRNWGLASGDPAPSLTEGGLIATFATAGTNAWFAGDLTAKGFVFDAQNDFTLTAKDPDGTASVSATGVSATGAHTYAFDTALALTLGQTWSAASGTTLRFARDISAASDYALALNGGGTFVWEGDVSLPGNINLTGSTLLLRNANLSSSAGSLALQDAAATIRLENATVRKPIVTFTSATYRNTLVSGAGTTNVVSGNVTWRDQTSIFVEAGSQLVFKGNVTDGGYSTWTGQGRDVSSILVTNGTLNANQYSIPQLSLHLWSSGNHCGDWIPVYSDSALYLHVTNALSATTPFYVFGPVDFCGKPQQCACLKRSEDTGRFYSETPAVLTVNQRAGGNLKTDEAASTVFVGHFEGAAGLRKKTTATLTLNAANPTTGSLEVAEYSLVLGPNGTWDGTDVRVSGETAVLKLQSSTNLCKNAELVISNPGGRVDVAEGVRARVRWLYLPKLSDPDPTTGAVTTNLVKATPGLYTSANCSYLTGNGELEVRGVPGMTLIFR